ncbi:nucleotide-sugar transmembrane transporter [Anaeramoeba flamelloides]|uniref:Nucleotide-sugar transmembrane transporter n=1 Tax=Anaeramoeba flamelloides TaxID=1746091 RepID=A0AAV7YEU4_9EUKA|nr:nucleotide-sugar transmembrane transporter [Anaeramoeba flamelloides]
MITKKQPQNKVTTKTQALQRVSPIVMIGYTCLQVLPELVIKFSQVNGLYEYSITAAISLIELLRATCAFFLFYTHTSLAGYGMKQKIKILFTIHQNQVLLFIPAALCCLEGDLLFYNLENYDPSLVKLISFSSLGFKWVFEILKDWKKYLDNKPARRNQQQKLLCFFLMIAGCVLAQYSQSSTFTHVKIRKHSAGFAFFSPAILLFFQGFITCVSINLYKTFLNKIINNGDADSSLQNPQIIKETKNVIDTNDGDNKIKNNENNNSSSSNSSSIINNYPNNEDGNNQDNSDDHGTVLFGTEPQLFATKMWFYIQNLIIHFLITLILRGKFPDIIGFFNKIDSTRVILLLVTCLSGMFSPFLRKLITKDLNEFSLIIEIIVITFMSIFVLKTKITFGFIVACLVVSTSILLYNRLHSSFEILINNNEEAIKERNSLDLNDSSKNESKKNELDLLNSKGLIQNNEQSSTKYLEREKMKMKDILIKKSDTEAIDSLQETENST